MKRKSLATLLSGFLTVALTGVGFASWLITGGETKTSNAGAVSAEKVEDQRVKITNLKVDNAAIAFGMVMEKLPVKNFTKGRNSFNAITKTLTTKLKVGTISHISMKSFGKIMAIKSVESVGDFAYNLGSEKVDKLIDKIIEVLS